MFPMATFPITIPSIRVIIQEITWRNLVVESYCVLNRAFSNNFSIILQASNDIEKTIIPIKKKLIIIYYHIHLISYKINFESIY